MCFRLYFFKLVYFNLKDWLCHFKFLVCSYVCHTACSATWRDNGQGRLFWCFYELYVLWRLILHLFSIKNKDVVLLKSFFFFQTWGGRCKESGKEYYRKQKESWNMFIKDMVNIRIHDLFNKAWFLLFSVQILYII